MGKHVHVLLSKDPAAGTGVCKHCGPVRLQRKAKVWRCINGSHAHVHKAHGLSLFEASQYREGKVCGICGSEEELVVDHCHETNAIRGVLCGPCNYGLGFFKDEIGRMESAIRYLSAFKEKEIATARQ
jgi:hypothetical protein